MHLAFLMDELHPTKYPACISFMSDIPAVHATNQRASWRAMIDKTPFY